MAQLTPSTSTTVRSHSPRLGPKAPPAAGAAPPRLRAMRAGFQLLGTWAPGVATRIAEHVFRTPPRPKIRKSESNALLFADEIKVELGTERIPTWSFGEGPTIVLVHGWGGRGMQLRSFIEPLVRRGYRVVLFDAPGHGASRSRLSSLPEVAAATRAVVDAVGPVHAVIAHSMGGPATVLAMQAGAEIERLALIAPPTDMGQVTHRFARFLHIPERVRDGLQRSIERRFLRKLTDLELVPIARRMTQPLLVVHDRDDRDVPFEEGASLARAWRGARLVETSGLGHTRILRDAGTIEEVVEFVDEHAASFPRLAAPLYLPASRSLG
ncbi:MAG: alpha/beta fold hydrolase [Polyangiaceae bacterium]|nr:alpha/beta fold hydrolase [Polyangiaceae bacterium]